MLEATNRLAQREAGNMTCAADLFYPLVIGPNTARAWGGWTIRGSAGPGPFAGRLLPV
jgi:hypothetical protein